MLYGLYATSSTNLETWTFKDLRNNENWIPRDRRFLNVLETTTSKPRGLTLNQEKGVFLLS